MKEAHTADITEWASIRASSLRETNISVRHWGDAFLRRDGSTVSVDSFDPGLDLASLDPALAAFDRCFTGAPPEATSSMLEANPSSTVRPTEVFFEVTPSGTYDPKSGIDMAPLALLEMQVAERFGGGTVRDCMEKALRAMKMTCPFDRDHRRIGLRFTY